jgi:hypothetical protein
MRSGGVLLSVHCDNAHRRILAEKLLHNTGARGIASTPESKADFGQSEKPMPRAQVNGVLKHRTFLTPSGPASLSEEPRPPEPALVDFHEGERRPAD